jgi:endonuclease VIII
VPEGDTVYLTARRLHDGLAGRVLTHTDFRVPRLATTDLSDRQVVETVSRGKHLLTRIDGGLTLHTHLRMDGSWRLFRAGTRWSGGPVHEIRVVLSNADWTAVGYRLPVVELLRTDDETTVVGHLGPDLLGADWDEDEAVRRLSAGPDREVGPALLDQRNLAGIGNLYKCEVLFLSGVTPWTPVRDVHDLAGVVRRAHRLLVANKDHWHQSTTGSVHRGEENWVYQRASHPCRRCGASIRRAMHAETGHEADERISLWCPHCQSGPAPPTPGPRSWSAGGG